MMRWLLLSTSVSIVGLLPSQPLSVPKPNVEPTHNTSSPKPAFSDFRQDRIVFVLIPDLCCIFRRCQQFVYGRNIFCMRPCRSQKQLRGDVMTNKDSRLYLQLDEKYISSVYCFLLFFITQKHFYINF